MDTHFIKGKYKVMQVLAEDVNYSAVLGVNIESKEKTVCLLNIYKGEFASGYAGIYNNLRHCKEFVEKFISDGAMVAVFKYHAAASFDEVFHEKAKLTWQERLDYAQLLFHLALTVSDFPPEVGCAAFKAENMLIDKAGKRLCINYMIAPSGRDAKNEIMPLLQASVRKVLPANRFFIAAAERSFLGRFESGQLKTIASVYSAWQGVKAEITAEYEKVDAMNVITRGFFMLTSRFKKDKKKTL